MTCRRFVAGAVFSSSTVLPFVRLGPECTGFGHCAAKFVRSPSFDSFHHISVHPQDEAFDSIIFFGHILVLILNSYINDVESRYLRQGCAASSAQRTTNRLLTIAAFRSSSSSTILSLSSLFKAS